MPMPLLEVAGLKTQFTTRHGVVHAVDGVDFSLEAGETLALVGESGCGKSATALSLMGLLPAPRGRVAGGSIRFDGRELVGLEERALDRLRGREIAMVFQHVYTAKRSSSSWHNGWS